MSGLITQVLIPLQKLLSTEIKCKNFDAFKIFSLWICSELTFGFSTAGGKVLGEGTRVVQGTPDSTCAAH